MSATPGAGDVGNRSTTLMKDIQRRATIATGRLNRPKLNGPGTKSLSPRNRAAIGMQYALPYNLTESHYVSLLSFI